MVLSLPTKSSAAETGHSMAEAVIYGVFSELDMGDGIKPRTDYFINIGTQNGVKKGTTLKVYRTASTYDLQSRKLHQDITFPIALVKVIHAEGDTSVARIQKLLPKEETPIITPKGIMIGDIVAFD